MKNLKKVTDWESFYTEIGQHLPTIEIHMLENFGPSLLNRDNNNNQKTINFGGTLRLRISSQCIGHAISEKWGVEDTWFTRHMGNLVATKLKEQFPEANEKYLSMVEKIVDNCITPKGDKSESSKTQDKKDHMATGCINDVNAFIDAIVEVCPINSEITEKDTVIKVESGKIKGASKNDKEEKAKGKKKEESDDFTKAAQILKKMQDTAATRPVSVWEAINGTMSTSLAIRSIISSTSVAHAFSVNEAPIDTDYYVAIDRWIKGESGAAHLNEQDIKSSCFYRYASINILSAVENILTGVDFKDKKEVERRINSVIEGINKYIKEFIIAVPGGKQHSMATSPRPSVVYITAGVRPQNYTRENAFLRPTTGFSGQDIVAEAAENLKDFIDNDPFCTEDYDKELWVARDEYEAPESAERCNLKTALQTIGDYINEKIS